MNDYSTPDTSQDSLDKLSFYDLAVKLAESQQEVNDLQQKIYNIQERMRKEVNARNAFINTSKTIVIKANHRPIFVELISSNEFIVNTHPSDIEVLYCI